MLLSTKGILLRKTNQGDSSLVLTFYTQKFGLKSYLFKGVKSKKNKKLGILYPLSLVTIEVNQRKENRLGYIKNISPDYIFKSVSTNITKSSIALFLNEVFLKTIREEEKNTLLFDALEEIILKLDKSNEATNFHLFALHRLSHVLGFGPQINNYQNQNYFDLENGCLTDSNLSPYIVNIEENPCLIELLGTNFDEFEQLKINAKERKWLLNQLIIYFQLHSHGLKKLTSLTVLQNVFSA